MARKQAPLPQLQPLDKESLTYTNPLPDSQVAKHLSDPYGHSVQAVESIASFNTHRSAPAIAMSKQASNSSKDKQLPAYTPRSYPSPSQHASVALHRPHTNAVIEAGSIRARDEVRLVLSLYIKLQLTDFLVATNAEHAAGSSNAI
jgi:hypothetical protein